MAKEIKQATIEARPGNNRWTGNTGKSGKQLCVPGTEPLTMLGMRRRRSRPGGLKIDLKAFNIGEKENEN